jgi:hypothetical protein
MGSVAESRSTMMSSRFLASAIWFSSTFFGGCGLICIERHAFLSLLVVGFMGAVTFNAAINLYYNTRVDEELAVARKKLVDAISGRNDNEA